MARTRIFLIALGIIVLLGGLGLLRFASLRRRGAGGGDSGDGTTREQLGVGFLPVTCHLTCPVTDFASRTSTTTRFESQRFMDFPTVAESVKAGRLEATFMVVPLAMKLREQGLPIKIVYLGHRDGSTVIVHKDSTARSLRDLRGKNFAIPTRFSNQYLVIRKLMEDNQIAPEEINFVEVPPPDMPGALAAHAIDAYFVGEPHAAKAELDGTGRVLYHVKDIRLTSSRAASWSRREAYPRAPGGGQGFGSRDRRVGRMAETHRPEAARVARLIPAE